VLLVYACALVTGAAGSWPALSRRAVAILVVALSGSVVAVHWPAERRDYSFDRVAQATKYYERSRLRGPSEPHDLTQAIVQAKWAAETAPQSADAHYNLGVIFESVGFYSGAAAEFQQTLMLEPDRVLATVALGGVRQKLRTRGDRARATDLPMTPFDQARSAEVNGQRTKAEQLYLRLVRRDPFHFAAYERLGLLYGEREEWDRAIRMLERAVELRPSEKSLLRSLDRAKERR
jgi:tetratricopeptide (TPR) repeat protein